jgi:hypothetical protein
MCAQVIRWRHKEHVAAHVLRTDAGAAVARKQLYGTELPAVHQSLELRGVHSPPPRARLLHTMA